MGSPGDAGLFGTRRRSWPAAGCRTGPHTRTCLDTPHAPPRSAAVRTRTRKRPSTPSLAASTCVANSPRRRTVSRRRRRGVQPHRMRAARRGQSGVRAPRVARNAARSACNLSESRGAARPSAAGGPAFLWLLPPALGLRAGRRVSACALHGGARPCSLSSGGHGRLHVPPPSEPAVGDDSVLRDAQSDRATLQRGRTLGSQRTGRARASRSGLPPLSAGAAP